MAARIFVMAVPLVENLWDGLPVQEGGLSVALASSFVKRLGLPIAARATFYVSRRAML
jgi:hypothetical protein